MTHGQRALWFLHQLDPRNPTYNVHFAARIHSALDVDALRRTFQRLVDRHGSLRSTFGLVDGELVQRVSPSVSVRFEVHSLAGKTMEEARQLLLRVASEAFDLERGPLFRVTVVHRAPNDHLLLVAAHHIVTDLGSTVLLIDEMAALYEGEATGRTVALPTLEVEYVDFVRWQASLLTSAEGERQWAYWRKRLAGDLPALELPYDRPRPSVETHRGASHRARLGPELAKPLEELARAEKVTPYTLFLASFQVLLHRMSGQNEILVGSPLAARGRAEFEPLVGYFVNPVVLRSDLSDDPPFRELLRRSRDEVLGALEHQDFPLSLLVERLAPERDAARSPMFQVMMSFERANRREKDGASAFLFGQEGVRGRLGSFDLEPILLQTGGAQFDLTLSIQESGDGLLIEYEYNSDLFDAATIEAIADRFPVLLRGILEDPHARVSAIPLLPKHERRRLNESSGVEREQPPTAGRVDGWIAERARSDPERTAIDHGGDSISYAELMRRVERVMVELRRRGVTRGSVVGVMMERSSEAVVAILAIWRADAIYLPLDPSQPRERLGRIVADAKPAWILSDRSSAGRLRGGTVPVLELEAALSATAENFAAADGPESSARLPAAGAKDPAYLIYTSGSTGSPKGVLVSHEALAHHASAIVDLYAIRPEDRVLQLAALSFDVSLEEIVPTLIAGATVVPMPAGPVATILDFEGFLERQRITIANLTASYWHAWVMERGSTLAPSPDLRLVVVGNERMPPESLIRWKRTLGERVRLLNAYGPTEATITTTVYDTARASERDALRVAIGRPIPGARLYVLDAHRQPAPIGVPGEAWIGGPGVAIGYWGETQGATESFISDPFSNHGGARLYRTGDRVRWRNDGELEFLGRLDDQVKIRGHRVELEEIEAALRRHPAVVDAAVVTVDREVRGTRLVAFVVLASPEAPTSETWRAFLAERLPEYMIPSTFAVREALPRTSAGKLDRRSLARAAPEGEMPSQGRTLPRTAAERAIAEIWSEVLGVSEIGIHDHFFALGGDSILSIQVVARARSKGLRLTTRGFFEQPTVAALAAAADAAESGFADRGPVTGECPLTPIQRWLLEQASPEPHHDNQAASLLFRETPDVGALERALGALLLHHDALRLRFAKDGNGWRSWITEPDAQVPLAQVDLSAVADEALGAALERESAIVQAGLDLEHGPLFRAVIFHVGSDQPAHLLLVAHHLVVDGVSWRILLEDLSLAYDRERGRDVDALAPRTTSFQAWARRLLSYAHSAAIEPEGMLWLAGASTEVTKLPVDRSDVASSSSPEEASARSVFDHLESDETRRLLWEAPRAHRARIDDLLLAALARTLEGWAGRGPWRVDLEGHGREELFDEVDLSRTVGWFTTLYPVLLDVGEEGTHAAGTETLDRVKRQLHAIPNHGLGYGLLRFLARQTAIGSGLEDVPAAEICFNYLGQLDRTLPEASPFVLGAEPLGACRSPRARRPYLLEVNALVLDERLQVEWTYSEARHEAATVERLAHRFIEELRRLLPEAITPPQARGISMSPSPTHPRPTLEEDPKIEDAYPLSPMQAGMLFHTLTDAGRGTYVEQMDCRLEGALDLSALEAAWARLVERHAVLRTAVVWEGLDQPLQIVRRSVRVPWEHRDWSARDAVDRESALAQLLRADRERGFELSDAPLMRLTLIRCADDLHYLVWTHHHLLLDGWSVPILLEELALLYAALRARREPVLAPAFRYRDYVDWLGRRDVEEAEAFWRRSLQGFRAATSLAIGPADEDSHVSEPDQETVDDVYAVQHARLSRSATVALERFARRHALTLGTLVRGAWAMLLSRYAQEEDVLFGSVVSGRPAELPGAETGVGLFIHTLPFRVRIDAERPLIDWLADLQRRQLEMLRFEHAPLVQIQEWSEVRRGQPLFETLLVFENYPLRDEATSALEAMGVRDLGSADKTNYPVTLAVSPGERLSLQIVYQRRRLDGGSIRRMLEHLEALLEGISGPPDRKVGAWSMLRADERLRLMECSGAMGRGVSAYPQRTIHALIAEQAALRPDAPALVHEHRVLSYAALVRRSAALASRLRAMGVGPGSRVALCMERSIEVVIAMLAVLESGAAYVPLDPAYPEARLAFLLEDCSPAVVLSQRRLLSRLPAHEGPLLCLDDVEVRGDVAPASPSPVAAGPDDLAYIMYTSGSTGRPKGIEVTHRGIVRLVRNTDWMQMRPDEVVLQVVSLSFDPSALEIWGCLLNGAKLVLHPSRTPSLDEIGEALRVHHVTSVVLITGLFPLMVEERLADLAGLRRLIVGGDVMPPEAARRVLEAYPGLELVNAYGPTEGTVMACAHSMTDPSTVGRVVPIGRPIAHTRVYLIGRDRQPVPIGIPGEIWIAGDGVARGYHGRPDLTRERFVSAPPGIEEARLYRTGDLGRWRADGTIEFLGRVDEQVKIRGFRIEPGEVEVALSRHAAVRECAVLAPRDERGERRLVAYVGSGTARPSTSELGDFLRRSLPEYMIPAVFVILDRLPLGPNGKVDRSALPDPLPSRREGGGSRVGPRTALERDIARAWSEVLRVESPGIDDDFLDSGGHSLLATQLVARLRTRVAPRLGLRDLYDAPTIRALAERIERDAADERPQADVASEAIRDAGDASDRAEEAAARGTAS